MTDPDEPIGYSPGGEPHSFRERISLLVPAYLRGELSAEERLQVEAAAKSDPAIADDIRFQRELRRTLQSGGGQPVDEAAGLDRLMASVRVEVAPVTEPSPTIKPVPVAANDAGASPRLWRIAAAALATLAVGQGIFIGTQIGDAPGYTLASEASTQAVRKVAFAPDAALSDIELLLRDVDAEIVAGPGALGLYTLGFGSEAACAAASTLESQPILSTVSSCDAPM